MSLAAVQLLVCRLCFQRVTKFSKVLEVIVKILTHARKLYVQPFVSLYRCIIRFCVKL